MSEPASSDELRIEFRRGTIHDVMVRDLRKFVDERGWLAELFRHDELAEEFYPQMAYISVTEPNVTRGPHEHVEQSDLFCFIGASNFKLRMWDARRNSPSCGAVMTLFVGADNPKMIIIPPGVVHAYRNVSSAPGVVINCPNRLFMGAGKREPVDEIRHEDETDSPYRMDD